jgi:Ca2+-binding EF-hand superfamily protein
MKYPLDFVHKLFSDNTNIDPLKVLEMIEARDATIHKECADRIIKLFDVNEDGYIIYKCKKIKAKELHSAIEQVVTNE